jgi:hypothetical protein
MPKAPFVTGHCLCGNVRYVVTGEPVGTGQCQCKDCQRASGTGHMSIARFKAEDVGLTGTTASFASVADSGNINTRHFCPTCGSRLYGQNSAAPGILNLAPGCMDDNDWFRAQRVVYTKDRPSWDVTPTDVPNFERMP